LKHKPKTNLNYGVLTKEQVYDMFGVPRNFLEKPEFEKQFLAYKEINATA
jgi:hypothetical protein